MYKLVIKLNGDAPGIVILSRSILNALDVQRLALKSGIAMTTTISRITTAEEKQEREGRTSEDFKATNALLNSYMKETYL